MKLRPRKHYFLRAPLFFALAINLRTSTFACACADLVFLKTDACAATTGMTTLIAGLAARERAAEDFLTPFSALVESFVEESVISSLGAAFAPLPKSISMPKISPKSAPARAASDLP